MAALGSFQVALVGNPNSGKTSLFNCLTGLNQKVGNFPGVTVDKKSGVLPISFNKSVILTDLPGSYSLYPRREDEWVSYKVLMLQDKEVQPDLVVLVADASNLKRNLLFASQILDLKIPVVIALTMMDLARSHGTSIDLTGLERELGVSIVPVNPRKGKGIMQLKKAIERMMISPQLLPNRNFIDIKELAGNAILQVQQLLPGISEYRAFQYLIHHEDFALTKTLQNEIEQIEKSNFFTAAKTQAQEVMQRYQRIRHIMQQTVVEADPLAKKLFTDQLDNLLLHRTWGYLVLTFVLFLLFQSIFWLAQFPMEAIDWTFGQITGWLAHILPLSWWSDLFINGIVAGLGGILIFIPQIMILFGLITLLEDSGYMARISFLTDKLMRKVGLNGKSVMPMISGFACAVPAIMSARNIENKKERLLTILITPFMSCSARLPVFTILIALIIPNTYFAGFLSLQGLVMMALYMMGTFMALFISWVAKWFIKSTEKSYFILELPMYRAPRWKNAAITMLEKARIFVLEAGRIIMIISIVLWVLSSFGPVDKMKSLTLQYQTERKLVGADTLALDQQFQSDHLAASFAGILGKSIEPAIRPLGYDWKIGIALITSFAAREVFVGTMATLYSVGEDANENDQTLKHKMLAATRPDGSPVYTLATGMSLMVFYLLAMQCMSTLAIVKRETNSWKWPLLQLVVMTLLAYVMSWLTYTLFA